MSHIHSFTLLNFIHMVLFPTTFVAIHVIVIMALQIAILSIIRCPVVYAERRKAERKHCIHIQCTVFKSELWYDRRMMETMFTYIGLVYISASAKHIQFKHQSTTYQILYELNSVSSFQRKNTFSVCFL